VSAPVPVGVLRLAGGAGLPLPAYMTPGAAGADVCAAVESPVVLAPGERALIPTGFALDVPEGYEVQIRPRSGLALRAGITLLNSPGTIDSDYRGPVGVIVANLGREAFTVERGDRIAQMVVAPVVRAVFTDVAGIAPTERGEGGFGSTGHAAEGRR
jgi:dUTP pyrophosphatase